MLTMLKLKMLLHRFFAIFGINIFPMSKIKKLGKDIIGIEESTFKREAFIGVNKSNDKEVIV
jgi:hypothetical protein